MARIRSRSRFVLEEQRLRSIERAQEKGWSRSRALEHYRRYGGRSSGEHWRELWQASEAAGPRPPIQRRRRKIDRPGGWIYHVELYLAERRPGVPVEVVDVRRWLVRTPRRTREERVVQLAMADWAERRPEFRSASLQLFAIGGRVVAEEDVR